MFEITEHEIDIQKIYALVQSPEAGAITHFIGTVRTHNMGKKVVALEYEAYKVMAVKKMEEIAKIAKEKWNTEKIIIVHRTGLLKIGDIAVMIAVSTKHRREAFEACEFLIEELKKVVPIWKKEIYEDGETWIAAHA